jgi:hypothetical protein
VDGGTGYEGHQSREKAPRCCEGDQCGFAVREQSGAELAHPPPNDEHLEFLPSMLADVAANEEADCVVTAAIIASSNRRSTCHRSLKEGPEEYNGAQDDDHCWAGCPC